MFFIPQSQLSIYTALRPNADGGHTLIHEEEDFDVETKFERCNISYGDRIWWYLSYPSISQSVVISTMITNGNFVVDTVSALWVFAG